MTRKVRDISSEELRRLREAFCAHFVRTGELDNAQRERLQALAFAQRGSPAPRKRARTLEGLCSVEGCERPNDCKGYCRGHYSKFYYYRVVRPRRYPNACSV